MLTEQDIVNNKKKFLEIVESKIVRFNNKDLLLRQLNESDFFTAPASSQYYNSYRGGLCQHSLAVYDNLLSLVNTFYHGNITISEESIAIVALFHDICKMNYYKNDVKNKKVYSPTGSKYDELGNYDWVSVPIYSVKDADDRFIYGNREMNSLFIMRYYFRLNPEEEIAVLHHLGGMGSDSSKDNIFEIYQRYPLALLLHEADLMACYLNTNE